MFNNNNNNNKNPPTYIPYIHHTYMWDILCVCYHHTNIHPGRDSLSHPGREIERTTTHTQYSTQRDKEFPHDKIIQEKNIS